MSLKNDQLPVSYYHHQSKSRAGYKATCLITSTRWQVGSNVICSVYLHVHLRTCTDLGDSRVSHLLVFNAESADNVISRQCIRIFAFILVTVCAHQHSSLSLSLTHTHTHTYACTHTCMHACTHVRTHTHTHTHTHTE